MFHYKMQRALLVVAVLADASSVSTVPPASAQSLSEPAHRGEVIVTRDCVMCHARGRKEPALADLLRRVSPDALRQGLATGITAGHPQMPRLRYDGNDIEAIMAFLQSIARE